MEYIVWPYAAHPDDDRLEDYEWNTVVLEGPQFEQRISLRDIPVFTSQAVYDLSESQLGQARFLAEAIYRANNRLLLPLWTDRVFLDMDFVGTIGQIYGDFRYVNFDPQGRALLWFSANEYYILNVTHVAPDRIFIQDYIFPDLVGKRGILLPLMEGRVDGDIKFVISDTKKHRASFTFKAIVERDYRYKLSLCLVLDGSGSMAGARWNNLRTSMHNLLDYIATFVESGYIDLSLKIVFSITAGNGPRREWRSIRDADPIIAAKAWISSVDAAAGVFSFPVACNEVVSWFNSDTPCTNIAMIMTDADDATDEIMDGCVTILTDILDPLTLPHSVDFGTAVNLYAVGIDSSTADLARISRLSNVGPAIRLTGTSLLQFDQILQGILFGEDTPLSHYRRLFTTYNGFPVLSRDYLDEQGAEEVITRARNGFLTPSGMEWYTDMRIINNVDYILNFSFMGAAEVKAFLIWMHSVRGQKREFWLPTQNRDIIMRVDQPDTLHMHIRRGGLDNPLRLLEEPFQIETTKGELLYRRFVNGQYVEEDPTVFRMTLDVATPRILRPRDIMGIHTLRKFRFSTDLASVNHPNTIQTNISMAVTRVATPFVPPPPPPPEPEPET